MWSTGCCIAEMMLGEPLFPGDSAVDQLVEIIKVLGSPSNQQIQAMNPHYDNSIKFPIVKQQSWTKIFKSTTDPLLIDLISKVLVYNPQERLTNLEALLHPYFDELRQKNFTINSKPIPNLFNFTKEELSKQPELQSKLVPSWYNAKP